MPHGSNRSTRRDTIIHTALDTQRKGKCMSAIPFLLQQLLESVSVTPALHHPLWTQVIVPFQYCTHKKKSMVAVSSFLLSLHLRDLTRALKFNLIMMM